MTNKTEWLVQMTVISFDSEEEAHAFAHALADTFSEMEDSEGVMASIRWGKAVPVEETPYVH